MAVLMPNATLGVRRRQEAARDAHGERVPAPWGPINGPAPGRTREGADATWGLAVDPSLWPVRQGDLVIATSGASWLVDAANLITNNLDDSVDYVRITGHHRTAGGTEPGGAWFVARHEPYVDPAPTNPDDNITESSPGLWIGHGPPPDPNPDTFPAEPGDEYIDTDTGIVYRLTAD